MYVAIQSKLSTLLTPDRHTRYVFTCQLFTSIQFQIQVLTSDVPEGRIKIQLYNDELPKYVELLQSTSNLLTTELARTSDNFAPVNIENMVSPLVTREAYFTE